MRVTVDSKNGLKTSLKVFVDKKTIEEKISTRLDELSKTINLKGFRPGKVPVDVLKKQFGKAIYGEVLDKILRETSEKAISEQKIKIVGQPKIDVESFGEGKDLKYKIEVEELPSIKLKPVEEIKITDYEISVSKKEIDDKINEIAEGQKNFSDKKENENSVNGDLVVFNYEATIDGKKFEGGEGKNTQIILGKDLFIKGFDNQLIGIKKNQEKNVTVVLPTNYPKEEYANKKALFKCKILNIKKAEKVLVDDNFAKSLGAKDLNDLKELINKQIQNQYKYSLDIISKEKILNHLDKVHEIKLPNNLIKQELSIIASGQKKEDEEKNKRKNEEFAKRRIKLGLILNAIGEKNKLIVNEQDIKNEIQKQVQSMPSQANQVIEYYKKNKSAVESLKGSLYEEKIIDLIKQRAKKTKKNISTKEAEEIIITENAKPNFKERTTKEKSTKETKKTPKLQKKTNKIRKK